MSVRLSDQQHQKLLDMIRQLQKCRSIKEFPTLVNALVANTVGCDSVSYNEIYLGMDRIIARLDPAPPTLPAVMEKWKLARWRRIQVGTLSPIESDSHPL